MTDPGATQESALPNLRSAEAAVEVLSAELAMVDSASDALDRKAALIPPILGAIAGLVIAPNAKLGGMEALALAGAILAGVFASILALRVLRPRDLNLGPNAQETASKTMLPPEKFMSNVALSMAKSVDALSEVTRSKGATLNKAMYLAATSILFLALARIAGGITMPDNQVPQSAQPAQTGQPAEVPASAAPIATTPPASGSAPAAGPGETAIQGFGQQMAVKAGPLSGGATEKRG